MNTKDTFVIKGLAGKKSLRGTVRINGAKNAALKAMAAAVLFDGRVELRNVPHTDDIHTLSQILRKLGADVAWNRDSGAAEETLSIDSSGIISADIDQALARGMRASVVLTGPLLARYGAATFPAPGGCVIGARPIDLFLQGYEKLGAAVEETEAAYRIKAPARSGKKGAAALSGTEIVFGKISVGATETLMMAAVLAEGRTILRNCAREPEIVNVAEWLNGCGAAIRGAGTPTIEIEGTGGKLLSADIAARHPYVTIPDRIEAGSYLILGALCASELTIEKCQPKHMEALIKMLTDSGVPIEAGADSVAIRGNTEPNQSFRSIAHVETREYPGFPTDLQPQMVLFLTQASGQSTVTETIFEGRFKYIDELQKMGADIVAVDAHQVRIKAPTPLHRLSGDDQLRAHDIRAGFAIVTAALCGEGAFTVNNVHLIDRGYERLEERLKALGADIERKSAL